MTLPRRLPKGRIKPKYNPIPTAREKAYHIWLMEEYQCACGCGKRATVVHHPLTRHPEQRWRRDHEFVVPMDAHCHMALHRAGNEADYMGHDVGHQAFQYRTLGYEAGVL